MAVSPGEDSVNASYTQSVADYAAELTEQTSELPEHLACYIDYKAKGRDMELNGDILTIETGFQEEALQSAESSIR